LSKRTGIKYEGELKEILEENGFYVVRAAGSHGIDLVAIDRNNTAYLIEVKSSDTRKRKLNGREVKQLSYLKSLAKQGYNVLIALRILRSVQWYIADINKIDTSSVLSANKMHSLAFFLTMRNITH